MKALAMNASRLLAGFALLLSSSAAVANPAAKAECLPKVEKAWIRAAPLAATTLAGYALLRNDCDRPFVLTGAKSPDFMMAQLHESKMMDGTMQMRHAKRTVIAARASLQLAPGEYHLMLMHPRRAMPEGKLVRVDFLLEDGRSFPADFKVLKEPPK